MYEEIGARIRGSTSWWGWGYPQFFVPGGPHPQAVYMHRAWRSLELVLNGGSPKREITLGCIGRAGVGRAVVGRPVVGSSGRIRGTRHGRGHPGEPCGVGVGRGPLCDADSATCGRAVP